MKRIKEVKNLLPFVREGIKLSLLSFDNVYWYANSIYSDDYNRYMDNKVNNLDFLSVVSLLNNLVLSYNRNYKSNYECRLIIEDTITSEKIGGISMKETGDNEISLGYWVLPAYKNRGYAQCAVNIIKELVFKLSNIDVIKLEIQSANIGSLIIAHKTGFTEVGNTNGKFMNNIKFELRKSQYVKR